MENLFSNYGNGTLYIRFEGTHYVRKIGHDWTVIDEAKLPEGVVFAPMHEKQVDVIKGQLEK